MANVHFCSQLALSLPADTGLEDKIKYVSGESLVGIIGPMGLSFEFRIYKNCFRSRFTRILMNVTMSDDGLTLFQ